MKNKLLSKIWYMTRMAFYVLFVNMLLASVLLAADISKGQGIEINRHKALENVTVTFHNRSMRITEAIDQIHEQTGFKFIYTPRTIKKDNRVILSAQADNLGKVLQEISLQSGVAFHRINDQISLRRMAGKKKKVVETIFKEQATITGVVTDAETGETVAGINVVVQGTSIGTTTDLDGKYRLAVPEDATNLIFTFIGYVTQEIPINGRTEINVQMPVDVQTLQDIVVVGYGTQKKINLTGAVDQVTSETFNNRPLPNISQGLQGVVPNLNITLADGKPIQSPTYNIRGTTSIGQGGSALVLIDGVEGDPSLLNPNDIASISVLKDAASASIYGARAAFGVVLITTKSPEEDRMTVTYTTNFSVKRPVTVPDLVTDGYQWASLFNEAWSAWNDYSQTPQNVNKTLPFSQPYLEELKRRSEDPSLPRIEVGDNGEYEYYYSTDWYDELYKDNLTANEHNISVSGRGEKTSLYVTGRYFGQEGLFQYNSDDYRMYNLRAKGSLEVAPWLTLGNNTQYSNMTYHNPLNVGEGGSIWRNIADEGHPMAPLLNPDGTLSYSSAYTVGDFYYGKNGIDMKERVFRNTTSFNTSFLENKLRVNGNFTFQNTDNNQTRIRVPVPYSRKPGVIDYVGTNTDDILSSNNETDYLAANLFGEYETNFGEQHYFKALLGYNYEQTTYDNLSIQRNGLIYEDVTDINLALGQSIIPAGGYERWNIMGGFFRLNYIYDDRYLLEVNGRYDGSSKFPSDQRFAFFPSVSAGWRITEEGFWNVSDNLISDLKLRASYGSLGNGNIDSYAFMEKFAIQTSDRILNGVRPSYTQQPNVIPNGLTWETSTTSNLGLDFSMLTGRLTFSGDAYIRKTTDMFTVGNTLPAVFGTTVPKGNYADLRTTGWEVVLGWQDGFQLGNSPFNYNVRLTLADNQSKILKYNNPNKNLNDYYEGQKVGDIWGYTTEGLFTSTDDIEGHADQSLIAASTSGQLLPGDIKFKDVNGDGVINNGDNRVDSPGDLTIIGNSSKRYTYGTMLGADWNNFFVSAFVQGVGKQNWWPGSEASIFWGMYNRPYNDMPVSHLDNIWSEDNPDAYFPRLRGYTALGSRELSVQQTRYIQNIGYIRLKNIQVGYHLPATLLEKVRISSARVYFTGENLWSWSPLYRITRDLDVEGTSGSDAQLTNGNSGNGYNYPMLKSFTLGLSVTF